MKRVLFVLFFLWSVRAQASSSVAPLFDDSSMVAGALIPFKLMGSQLQALRKYEVLGASAEECRLSRDPHYADVFHLKCTAPKSSLKLRFTLYVNGQFDFVTSAPFNVRDLGAGLAPLTAKPDGA